MIKNKVLILAMLIVAIVAVGSVSAADDVAVDIDEPADDIAVDEIAIEEPIVGEVIENFDCVDKNNFDSNSITYDALGSSEDVDFNSDKEIGFDSVEIQFNGISNKENIINWTWNFGDGEIGHGQNVVHTYSKIGSYNVNLTIKDINDNNYSITKNNYINVFYGGSAVVNPDFEKGEVNVDNTVYGWIVDKSPIVNCIQLRSTSVSGSELKGNYVYIAKQIQVDTTTGNSYAGTDVGFGQYINFDCLNNITFYVYSRGSQESIITYNIGDIEKNLTIPGRGSYQTIDTSNISGVHLFRIYLYSTNANYVAFDNFICSCNELVCAYFTYTTPTVEKNQISVQFYNGCYGSNITDIFWEFDDGTTTSELNPTHNYTTTGRHTVKITTSNSKYSNSYFYDVILDFPSINGNIYQTIQDAINNASNNEVINIPFDCIENLEITNKNLTLNFNGNKLTGSINVNDGAIVTVNNISDVSSVSTDDSSKLTIADSNINSNLELKSGNIDLNSVNFNNSILTITAANTTLVNVNVANGGIVINGGKSKITKSNFTDSTNVITQNDGELELTNNIIKNNNNAINITGGSATISYNAIYNNTGDLTLTGATVTNNWFGTNQVTGFESYLRLVITAPVSEMYPGKEYTITAELIPNTGSLEGSIDNLTLEFTSPNGETTPVTINNNNGEFKFTAGQITDEVTLKLFNEDYTLVNGENPVSIVTEPLDTNITITSPENGVVVIRLSTAEGNVSGENVSYTINGGNKVNNVTDANGQIIIKDLTGKVTINATYDGNKTLNPSAANKVFDFTIATVITAANVSTTYGAAKELIITLTANGNALANKTINVAVGTINKNLTTNASGQVSVDVSGLNPDTYVATIAFAGDEVYVKSNANASVVINKVASSLSAPAVSATYNVAKNLVITLTANGKALNGQKVTVKVGTISKTLTTNAKGQVSVAISSLVPKTYQATIKFAGDKIYTASSTTAKVVVVKAKSKITAKKATFKAKKKTKKYTITLKAGKKAISKVKVTLKVKGKTYKAKTNAKGKATFKINKLTKKGKHTATIKFAGNKSYKATSKKIKLTVKK